MWFSKEKNLQILDIDAVGKILFQHQPHLTLEQKRQRIYRLAKRHRSLSSKNRLPLKKIGGRYLISLRKLNEWVESKGL